LLPAGPDGLAGALRVKSQGQLPAPRYCIDVGCELPAELIAFSLGFPECCVEVRWLSASVPTGGDDLNPAQGSKGAEGSSAHSIHSIEPEPGFQHAPRMEDYAVDPIWDEEA